MQHLAFECPALQGLRDRYNGLLTDHAATMVHFMWQHDNRAVAQFIQECMDYRERSLPLPDGSCSRPFAGTPNEQYTGLKAGLEVRNWWDGMAKKLGRS